MADRTTKFESALKRMLDRLDGPSANAADRQDIVESLSKTFRQKEAEYSEQLSHEELNPEEWEVRYNL